MKTTQNNIPNDIDISAMVDAFLGWPLPKTFAPDCGISFDRTVNGQDRETLGQSWWPVGTNLFTADEARQLFEFVSRSTFNVPEKLEKAQNLCDKIPDLVFGNKWMSAAEVSEYGFFLWDCPKDDHIFGSPFIEPVKIYIRCTNWGEGVQQGDLFRTGDLSCYKLRNLPGRFAGPLQADHAGLHPA